MDNKVKRASFSIEDDYVDLMKRIAKRRRMTMTALLRFYIDQDAAQLGISPVAALPKATVRPQAILN